MSKHSKLSSRLSLSFICAAITVTGRLAQSSGSTIRRSANGWRSTRRTGLPVSQRSSVPTMRNSSYRPQRMWEDGLSYRQTAALFNIRNAGCLSDWERRYETVGIDALAPRRRGRPRTMPESPLPKQPQAPQYDETKSRAELLAELNYLRMENAYLKNWFCRKLFKRSQKRPSLDTVMQRVRRIAEMPIGHWLKIGACGSCEPPRYHPVLLTQTERI